MKSKLLPPMVLILISCLLTANSASAVSLIINSRWAYTIPTINGTISAGEWTDATVSDFTFEMRQRSDGSLIQTLNAKFYVKNDLTNIYAAVQIFNEDYDAQNVISLGYDSFGLLFEEDHDHTLENGDNGVGIDIWSGGAAHSNNDWYYHGYWDLDVSAGKTNDGAFSWSHTAYPTEEAMGTYTFEMRIPLVGSDGDAYDLAITSLPSTVGFKIWFYERDEQMDGVYPDDPAVGKNYLETIDATTYGDLILHPRYNLTITVTAGGTTNPAPAVYTYGWGEVASVLAIPNIGYIFDHWELDSVNVGSTNPYQVTMDRDHTLRAIFKLAPPAVGGMAAPIVISMDKPNLLTPLIWITSTIALSITMTIAFVKLKKKEQH